MYYLTTNKSTIIGLLANGPTRIALDVATYPYDSSFLNLIEIFDEVTLVDAEKIELPNAKIITTFPEIGVGDSIILITPTHLFFFGVEESKPPEWLNNLKKVAYQS